MKRLIAAGVLLIFLTTAYFTGYFYISKTCEEANKLLTECVLAYENNDNAEEKTKKMEEFWSKKEKTLSIFTNHSSIDNIELSIHSLLIYSSSSQKDLFREYSGRVKTQLHQLMEDTVPGAHSIF